NAHICVADACSAYLQAPADPRFPIHVTVPQACAPPGYDPKTQCLKLNKAVYGCKLAGTQWMKKWQAVLNDCGFTELVHARGVYQKSYGDGAIEVYAHVDDNVFSFDDHLGEEMMSVRRHIDAAVDMEWLGWDADAVFLGCRVRHSTTKCPRSGSTVTSISLDMTKQIEHLAAAAGVVDDGKRAPATPATGKDLPPLEKLAPGTELTEHQRQYAVLLGTALYIIRVVRLDLMWAIMRLAPFSSNPKEQHFDELMRLIRYMYHTKDDVLRYTTGTTDINVYVDASFEGVGSRSTSGVVVMMSGAAVVARSVRQSRMARSAAEAELYAFNLGLTVCKYIDTAMKEHGDMDTSIVVHCDN
ncbi:MAG: reverse transcriptase domain-containing protein, partial [Candidatus Thermoplasmatota archaeon]|nr:reverse transcriptase domain-containing protein [Candidatus Thermoplasmatota archaeon]